MNIQKAVIMLNGSAISFYKKQTITARGSDSANIVLIKVQYQYWEVSSNAIHDNAF